MMFPNAYEGVKKIHKAEILSIVAAVLSLVAGILGGITDKNPESGAVVGAALVVIVAAVLMMVASVICIVGVNKASKDEPAFKNAVFMLLIGVAANALVTSFSTNQLISGIGNALAYVSGILGSYFVCTGIINLADRMGDGNLSARGKTVRKALAWIWSVSAGLNLLSAFFTGSQGMAAAVTVSSIVSGIASIVAFFFYIGLLGKAKLSLAK